MVSTVTFFCVSSPSTFLVRFLSSFVFMLPGYNREQKESKYRIVQKIHNILFSVNSNQNVAVWMSGDFTSF